MLGVIVLNQVAAIWVDLFYERNKGFFEDCSEKWCIHLSFKYTYSSTPSVADSSPDIHFYQELGPWLVPGLHTMLIATSPAMVFKLNSRFICEN